MLPAWPGSAPIFIAISGSSSLKLGGEDVSCSTWFLHRRKTPVDQQSLAKRDETHEYAERSSVIQRSRKLLLWSRDEAQYGKVRSIRFQAKISPNQLVFSDRKCKYTCTWPVFRWVRRQMRADCSLTLLIPFPFHSKTHLKQRRFLKCLFRDCEFYWAGKTREKEACGNSREDGCLSQTPLLFLFNFTEAYPNISPFLCSWRQAKHCVGKPTAVNLISGVLFSGSLHFFQACH